MSKDLYTCKVCNTDYSYRKNKKVCEKSHNSSITDHVDSKEIKRLEWMTKALIKNDYDENYAITDNTQQQNLRNRKVRKKKLTDFT